MTITTDQVKNDYEALTERAGLHRLADRTMIEIHGKDRTTFLNGFCTNDIKRLQPGQGCEAFLTNVQGKTSGFVNVFCEEEALILDSSEGQAEPIITSLDRYVIREDVKFVDRSTEWAEMLVSGAESEKLLATAAATATGEEVPSSLLGHSRATIGSVAVAIRRVSFTGLDCFLVQCSAADVENCVGSLAAAGIARCGPEAVEIARVEAGSPVYGRDITIENLPQEVDRNASAISFTKGCYLGQETVARIDALGHVNRLLRGLRFDGALVPEPNTELVRDGKTLATINSAVWSLKLNAPLALAYVRREFQSPGTRLDSESGSSEIVSLPLA